MPTENPRITITMSVERLEEISSFRYKNKMKNQTQAILALINKGFEALKSQELPKITEKQKAPAEMANALEQEIVKCFEKMDSAGKRILYEIAAAMVESGRYSVPEVPELAARKGQRDTPRDIANVHQLIEPETTDI